MTASRSVRLATACYRLAVALLPNRFRGEYGAELVSCFESIAGEARRRGVARVASVTLYSLVDLVSRGSRQHLDALRAGALGPGGWWTGTWQDLTQAARRLRRRPSFTLVAVLTLAAGIAAATSVFSLVNGVVLRPLPYPEADRLVKVDHGGRGLGLDRGLGMAHGFYRIYTEHVRAARAMAMYGPALVTLTGAGDPVQLDAYRVTPSLGEVLQVAPGLGRWFTVDEGQPGATPVVVLSDRLWRERFGADPAIIRQAVSLNDVPHQVVGVMPPGFGFPSAEVRLWLPRIVPNSGIGGWNEEAVARLAPGADGGTLERELASIFPQVRADQSDPGRVAAYLDDAGVFPVIVPLKDSLVGDVRATLWVLLGTVGFVLLIAFANVANLFLVRAEGRQREAALRTALGAGRVRLVRGDLAESLLLTAAAGGLGLAGASATVGLLRRYAPVTIPRLDEVGLDATVVGVTLGLTLLLALVLGLIPSLHRAADLGVTLKEGARRTTAGKATLRGQHALVVAQVALALVLLIGSGLLLRTFASLRSVDLGFTQRSALVFTLALPGNRYPDRTTARAFHHRVLERLEAVPGVRSAAGVAHCLPLSGNLCHGDVLEVEGRPAPEGAVPPVVGVRFATTGYFQTMGIGVEGRRFTAADESSEAPTAILSRDAAEAYFPGENPVGRRVRFGADRPWHTVVGVAGNVRSRVENDAHQRLIYLPLSAAAADGPHFGLMSYVVASTVPPGSLAPMAERVVHELDPALPVAGVRTLQGIIDNATAPAAFALTLVALAATMALLLGAVGVYAVIAFAVGRRTAEIGVRLALGARASEVRWMVIRQGGVVVLAGIGLGLAGAFALTRTLRGMLFGVSPTDPLSWVGLTMLMAAVATLALWLPARRAARIDPIEALRAE